MIRVGFLPGFFVAAGDFVLVFGVILGYFAVAGGFCPVFGGIFGMYRMQVMAA